MEKANGGEGTPPPIIERPRLRILLERSTAPVLAIVAPAGYGKTTLARQWTAAAETPFLWMNARTSSHDVAALVQDLVGVLRDLLVNGGSRVLERLGATGRPDHEVDVLAELLLADLPPADGLTLVIDDYHHVEDSDAAARLVELIVDSQQLRLALTSRVRPRWATTRRLLYGDVFEVGAVALAMTPDEATTVLDQDLDDRTQALLALADGWPAVIGLAALSSARDLPGDDVETTLQAFLAEELLAGLSDTTRLALVILAFTPAVDFELARELLDDAEATRVFDEAQRCGALQLQLDGTYQLQPLVKAFVLEEVEHKPRDAVSNWLLAAVTFLSDRGRWDEAFNLIEHFGLRGQLEPLVRVALDSTLKASRVATLRRWTEYATAAHEAPALRELMASELALREGAFLKAEAMGRSAAEAFGPDDPLTARAYRTAGRAAHLASRDELALRLFAVAKETARTQGERLEAIWGEWNSAIDLELESAVDIRSSAEAEISDHIAERTAFATSALMLQVNRGSVASLELGHEIVDVVDEVDDPLSRCAFRSIYTMSLNLAGQYEKASQVAASLHADALAHRLDFVVPYALCGGALSRFGQRRYIEAAWMLVEARLHGARSGDSWVGMNATALFSACEIAQGRYRSAVECLAHAPEGRAPKAMVAELDACRGLALACLGHSREAKRLATRAERMTTSIEARAIASATLAIAELGTAREVSRLDHFVREVTDRGNVNALVLAYRASPALATSLAHSPSGRALLQQTALQAGDTQLLLILGLDDAATEDQSFGLTPREIEVLQMLTLSNAEIAKRLFISEATVKVHVRRIFEKLNVKSRTQAALHPAAERFRRHTERGGE